MRIKQKNIKALYRHLRGLESLLSECGNTTDVTEIFPLLQRIEKRQYADNIKYCNGIMDEKTYEKRTQKRENEVINIFNNKLKGLFINQDPRGYALKIKGEGGDYDGLHRDLGGYYILAPDFD